MQIYVPIKIIIFLFNIYKQFSHIAGIYKISRFFSKKTSHLLASQLNQSLQIRGCRTDNTSLVTFLVLILICQFRFFHAKRGCAHTHMYIERTQQIVNFIGTYSIDIDSRPATNVWYVNTIMRTDLVRPRWHQ